MMMGMGMMGMPPGLMGMGPAGMGPGMMGGPPRPGMMGPPMPPGGVLSPPIPYPSEQRPSPVCSGGFSCTAPAKIMEYRNHYRTGAVSYYRAPYTVKQPESHAARCRATPATWSATWRHPTQCAGPPQQPTKPSSCKACRYHIATRIAVAPSRPCSPQVQTCLEKRAALSSL